MAEMIAFLPAIGQGLSLFSSIAGTSQQIQGNEMAAAAARRNAELAKVASDFEAKQLRQQSTQSEAMGQIAAEEQRRAARFVQSRTLAVAAASGAGVTDPTVVDLLSKTAGEGAYRASALLYGAQERARTLRMQAAAKDYEGAAGILSGESRANAFETAGDSAALTGGLDVLSKGIGLFGKYAGGGPKGGILGGGGSSSGKILDAGTSSIWDFA